LAPPAPQIKTDHKQKKGIPIIFKNLQIALKINFYDFIGSLLRKKQTLYGIFTWNF
jgi:hypothetical protein